jgi:biotin carboxyl carrier protein
VGQPDRGPEPGSAVREVVIDGWRFEVVLESERRFALRAKARRGRTNLQPDGHRELRAVIPGRIVATRVAIGDEVVLGQPVLVLEAMKMQNEVRAPGDGRVERLPAGVGDNVEVGDLLMVIT